MSSNSGSITDVSGLKVGHAQNHDARTGCTVILCGAEGAVAAVDVRGAAPGTRETDLLEPGNLVERVHAIVLAGGSVFGLDAACGVVRYLEEHGIGFDTGAARVPIVPAAVIYDLGVGSSAARPDSAMGYAACGNASSEAVATGAVGAGAGATVGKMLGHGFSTSAGIGMASMKIRGGATVGVLAVVNAFGDIVDSHSGEILAGARSPNGSDWVDTSRALATYDGDGVVKDSGSDPVNETQAHSGQEEHWGGGPVQNTTLAVVATDASLSRSQLRRVAMMAHDGLARSIRPVHTMFDGDTVFSLSTGKIPADVTVVGSAAADLLSQAIENVARNPV